MIFKNKEPYSLLVFAQNINELKKTGEALQLSEEKFSKAFKFSPNAVTLTRLRDGKIIDTNDSALNILGFTPQEAIGHTTLELGIWSDPKDRVSLTEELSSKGFVLGRDFVLKRKDGTKITVTLSASSLKIQNEDCFLSSFLDVTEQKRAEQRLWQAKNDWERTFDAVPDLIMIIDCEHRIVRANRSMIGKIGVTPQQVAGLPCYNAVHDANLPPTFCPHAKTICDGKEHVAEVHEPKLGGDFVVSTTPLKDENGRLIGSVHVARDITKRKKIEEELKSSETRFRSLYENSLDAVMLTIPNGAILSANPAAQHMLGMTEDEIKKAGRNGILVMDDRAAETIKERAKVGRAQAELTLRRKGGSKFEAEVSSGLFTDGDGVTKTSMIMRDITERKKAEEVIREREQLYRTLFDNSDDGFILLEPFYDQNGKACDFRFLKVNPAFERQTGLRAEDVEGKNVGKAVSGLELEFSSIVKKVVETGEAARYESFNQDRSRLYEGHYFPFIRGRVGVLFRDITERKKAEDSAKAKREKISSAF